MSPRITTGETETQRGSRVESRRGFLRLLTLGAAGAWTGAGHAASPVMERCPGSGLTLGGQYNAIVLDMLERIRTTQSANLLEGAHAIARAVLRGKTCWYNWDCGHSITFDMPPGRNGVPELLTIGFDPGKAADGDVFLASKRSEHPVLAEKDIVVIGTPSPWSLDAAGSELVVLDAAKSRIRPYSDIWIENGISVYGGVLNIPGSPAPLGPVSGILGIVTLWMMMGDACRILAREGKPVPVRGDEPERSGSDGLVSLESPLIDDYYRAVTERIRMIEAEAGDIARAASMAVDSVLSGGKVYCYGRYYETLPVEAKTRRSGLALLNDLSDRDGVLTVSGKAFEGSPRDLVIMGVYSPDDETDLRHLDTIRRTGAKTVSIGPMTRDMRIPEGRTVPKEADIHLGRSFDTYGLFALPGFARRVCPLSGALLMQTFWVTCIEIAAEIMRRTGNVPGIYRNGAIEGGLEHLTRVNEVLKARGY